MISLCVIGRNNQKTIGPCIQSAKPLVKEIIFVDTGSSDSTKKIAESLGANVYDFKWNDNYGDAKNEAFSKATQPWILSLDSDETIALRDLQKIKALVSSQEYDGYYLVQRNYTNQKGTLSWTSCKDDKYEESKVAHGYAPRMMVRLFKNNPKIRAEGVAHDSVIPSIQRIGGKIKETDIPIHHFGSLSHSPEHTAKYIELELKNIKGDFYQEYQIGSQYHSIGKLDEAIEHLVKSLQMNPNFGLTYLEIALIGMKRGKISEARPVLIESIRLDERESAWSALGVIEVHEKNFDNAVKCFQRAIELNPKNADHHYNLSQVLKELGKPKEAKEEFGRAVYYNPDYKKTND
ncbi:tetratricopeptide repeat protein [Candidatus Pacearchaeota archaeon]|nr:tetratricopeptide repeat protein [Candidatus Pacearchaeota archaeon]